MVEWVTLSMGQFQEDTASANKLLVEATVLMRTGEAEGDVDSLEEALKKLKMIIDLYPSTDMPEALRVCSGSYAVHSVIFPFTNVFVPLPKM